MEIANNVLETFGLNSGGMNKINTERISVKKNVITLDERTLQISNVSQLYVAEPASKIPIIAIILFLVFVGTYFMASVFTLFSLLGMIVAGFYIYLVIMDNLNKGYFIYLNLNSGFTYLIHCQNRQFAEEVREVIENCINDIYHKQDVMINMNQEVIKIGQQIVNVDQSINDSTVVSGDHNEVNK